MVILFILKTNVEHFIKYVLALNLKPREAAGTR